MAIELHCNFCGKLVKAPDEAAGKQGKCPACHQRVYIPTPSDRIEPLDLAPADEAADARQRALEHETAEFAASVAGDRSEGAARAQRPAGRDAPAERPESRVEKPVGKADLNLSVARMVEEYAVAMSGGDLVTAEAYGEEIRRNYSRAEATIDTLLNQDPLPDRLANVPRPVLLAFFKQLRPAK